MENQIETQMEKKWKLEARRMIVGRELIATIMENPTGKQCQNYTETASGLGA